METLLSRLPIWLLVEAALAVAVGGFLWLLLRGKAKRCNRAYGWFKSFAVLGFSSFCAFVLIFEGDLYFGVRRRAVEKLDPTARLERISHRVLEEMLKSDPRMRGRFLAYLDEHRGSEGQAAARLATRGMKRLDPESLRERNHVIVELLEHVDAKTCADFLGGTPETGRLIPALAKLDDASVEVWARLGVKASLAEINQVKVTPTTDPMVQLAFQDLYAQMEGPMRVRLGQHFQRIADDKATTQDEGCWASRTFFRALVHVAPPGHAILMRLVGR